MKKELMNILACPICKGDLVLNITKENDEEIVSGTIYCSKCNEHYPIEDGIPNMLPPDLRE
ncbi:MAG: methytransferase partner Trm112 [Methanosarcinaceae archaeon]|nr:methytransferase partner Trm112 [Methanosarcinaceae archaeon]MCL7411240.1 methytransferase partner Trm112 [Methanosarcinaceae archaeon]MDF1532933.1 methytransferase partner Trm112 [Methanosarcinaceae archaeon]MDO9517367.1 methytransferase partner Trm112 [Methanosarcinaceae archaeon]